MEETQQPTMNQNEEGTQVTENEEVPMFPDFEEEMSRAQESNSSHRTRSFFGAIPPSEMNRLPRDLRTFIEHLQQHVQQHLESNNIQTQPVATSTTDSSEDTSLPLLEEIPEEPSQNQEPTAMDTDNVSSDVGSSLENSESTVQESQTSENSPEPNVSSQPQTSTMIRFVIFYETVPANSSDPTTPSTTSTESTPAPPLPNVSGTTSANAMRQLVLNLILTTSTQGNFDDIMNSLFLMHQSRGPPPTSKNALENLLTVEITQEALEKGNTCTICFDELEIGLYATKLPCHHIFHQECINKWLKERNTCPVCRYELPVDDQEYEQQRVKRMAERQVNEETYFNDSKNTSNYESN